MENQNQQTTQPQYQQTVVIVGKQKSVGVAFLLAFLFGPLGLLYASVVGGIVMMIVSALVAIVTLGFGLLITWPVCVIWAIIAANNANKKMVSGAGLNINTNFGNTPIAQPRTTETTNSIPEIQQQSSQAQVHAQPKADIGDPVSKSIGDRVAQNKKWLIGGGSILGLVVLIVLIKFLLGIDLKKDNSSQEQKTVVTAADIKTEILISPSYVLGDLPHLMFKDFATQEEQEYECDWSLPTIKEIVTKCEGKDGCPALEKQAYSATLKLELMDVTFYDPASGEMKATGKKEKRWVIAALEKIATPINSSSNIQSRYAKNNEAFYIVNVAAVKTESQAITRSAELKNRGNPSGYLWIPDYASLSGAQFFLVYIGPYSTQYDCEVATEEYRKKQPDAYGLLVSQERKRVQINGIGKITVTQK